MALVRRGVAGGPGAVVTATDADVAKVAPDLLEFLTRTSWDSETRRQTGTVMVLSEDGVFKAWVHDRDGACACWVTAGSLLDLLDAVERALGDQTTNWRKDGARPRR